MDGSYELIWHDELHKVGRSWLKWAWPWRPWWMWNRSAIDRNLFSIFTSNLRIKSGSELINYSSDTKLSGTAFAEEDQNITQDQLDHWGQKKKKKRMKFNSTKFKVTQSQTSKNFCQELATCVLETAEEKEKTWGCSLITGEYEN